MLEVNLSGLLGQPEVSAFLRGIVGRAAAAAARRSAELAAQSGSR